MVLVHYRLLTYLEQQVFNLSSVEVDHHEAGQEDYVAGDVMGHTGITWRIRRRGQMRPHEEVVQVQEEKRGGIKNSQQLAQGSLSPSGFTYPKP